MEVIQDRKKKKITVEYKEERKFVEANKEDETRLEMKNEIKTDL